MHLTDFPSVQIDNFLLNTIKDIAQHVEIKSNLCIVHPDYKSLELPKEVVERVKKLPDRIQRKHLSLQLRSFLYGIYYNGSMKTALADKSSEQNILPLDIENNTVFGMDLEFYNRLHDANSGTGHFDPSWLILKQENDNSLIVNKGGLKLHIERDSHLKPTEQSAAVGNLVAIRLPKNFVQNGFYMAVSNAGQSRSKNVVRIYFNLTSEGAVAMMSNLTQQFNDSDLPFSFKALYNPNEYERYDSGVLYFGKEDYRKVKNILQTVYQHNRSFFKPEIPLFTKHLAPGMGLAEEPNINFSHPESFGMNRCQIVANGLLAAYKQGDNSLEARMNAIYQQFSLLDIDLNHPYLNARSENVYS